MDKRAQNSRQLDFSNEFFLKPVERTGDNSCDEKNTWDFQVLRGSDDDDDSVKSPVRTTPAHYPATEMEQSSKSLQEHHGERCHENSDFETNKDEFHEDSKTFPIIVESVNITTVDLNSHNIKTPKQKNSFSSGNHVKSSTELGKDVGMASSLPSQQHSQGSNVYPSTGSQVLSITAIAETEHSGDFAEVPLDEDLFWKDDVKFKSLYESCDDLFNGTHDQVTGDSQGSVDFIGGDPKSLLRSVDFSNERSDMMINKKDTMCDDTGKVDDRRTHPVPEIPTSSQRSEKSSSDSQKQSSLTTFFKKANNQATSTKPVLRQTDIGVYFGLRPLKKPTDDIAPQPSGTMQNNSSKGVFDSNRNKSWTGKMRYNLQDSKNPGDNSEGQSSFPGDVRAVDNPARKKCPFYRRIPDSAITVDAFRYGNIAGCRAYFLSHFHYDHYAGLTGRFTNHIYCSKVNVTGK